jgi:hypothetical protein
MLQHHFVKQRINGYKLLMSIIQISSSSSLIHLTESESQILRKKKETKKKKEERNVLSPNNMPVIIHQLAVPFCRVWLHLMRENGRDRKGIKK